MGAAEALYLPPAAALINICLHYQRGKLSLISCPALTFSQEPQGEVGRIKRAYEYINSPVSGMVSNYPKLTC